MRRLRLRIRPTVNSATAWRVGGHADDLDPELTCRTQVDIVEAGTAQRHEPRPAGRESLQCLPVELVVHEHADAGEALGEARRLHGEPAP